MNGNRAYQQYQKTRVQTANQGKLILMLYQGAIRFLNQAEKSMSDRDYEQANNLLLRVQDIINELRFSLEREKGGEIAENLYALYDFMYRELVRANTSKEAEHIQRVRDMLKELLASWQEVVEGSNGNGATASGAGVDVEVGR